MKLNGDMFSSLARSPRNGRGKRVLAMYLDDKVLVAMELCDGGADSGDVNGVIMLVRLVEILVVTVILAWL